ncbi:hypothetical protein OAJ08_02080 [Candidatus Nitrosopelagicus sp.]|jgi:hypothetical protein|nr:hypothetical protein [Candidatus Nitrosopelagicus sp.]|tara:strand:- start:1076 stop:1579 length:504 start_codon:yes stop_codon:yes gene_type:complete
MRKNIGFRSWFYFRTGWSMYFAFVLSAVNTLTVTYYLAVEKVPFLVEIFPTFLHYVLIFVAIGVPILVTTGYAHFKRTSARKAEVDISVETNPYMIRTLVNSEYILKLNLILSNTLLKIQNNQKLSETEIKEISSIQTELNSFMKDRNVSKERDLEFFRKMVGSNIK